MQALFAMPDIYQLMQAVLTLDEADARATLTVVIATWKDQRERGARLRDTCRETGTAERRLTALQREPDRDLAGDLALDDVVNLDDLRLASKLDAHFVKKRH
jgi:hypothetical protein